MKKKQEQAKKKPDRDKKQKTVNVRCRIDPERKDKFVKYAKKRGISMSGLLRMLIDDLES